jgi:hypothetical protein
MESPAVASHSLRDPNRSGHEHPPSQDYGAASEQDKTQKWALFGGLFLLLIFGAIMYNRFRITQKQKEIIELKQKEVVDSITYAKRIQTSLLPTEKYIERNLKRLKK